MSYIKKDNFTLIESVLQPTPDPIETEWTIKSINKYIQQVQAHKQADNDLRDAEIAKANEILQTMIDNGIQDTE